MQLFTIGTIMLNMDGTPKLDTNTGKEVLTYNNHHIMSYARAWTGFDRQKRRGNIELSGGNVNRIDPLNLVAEYRDVFPKINLENGFIGDGFPLCTDLPEKSFLRKGATYRLLGSSSTLQLTTTPPYWRKFDPLVKYIRLDTSSNLYNELCQPSTVGGTDCNYENEVTLTSNLECFDQECKVDTLNLLEVSDKVFYEYVRQPCVELTFFENARTITYPYRNLDMCADPKTIIAREACCSKSETEIFARDGKFFVVMKRT